MFVVFQAQLTVTPKEEGILKIVGVRWKLSGSVVSFHNFEHDLVKKRVSNVRRPKESGSSSNLKFLVIKVRLFFLYLLYFICSQSKQTINLLSFTWGVFDKMLETD